VTRLILALASLIALAGVPASGARASLQASSGSSSVGSAQVHAVYASQDGAAVDPAWIPTATVSLTAPSQQREPAPSADQNHAVATISSIGLPVAVHTTDVVHAIGRHATWTVATRGYRATGPPDAAIALSTSTSRARLA